jgi:hypothetical protein
MSNTLTVKQDHQNALNVQPSQVTDRWSFSTERTAGWFLAHNSKARFHFLHFQRILFHISSKTVHKCIAHHADC